MKKTILLLFLVLIPIFGFKAHKFYISLINVEHSTKENTIQISMRIFIDDLQQVLQKNYDQTYELATSDEPVKKVNKDIDKYAHKHFNIAINGKDSHFNYLGKEYEHDVVYLYFEVDNIKTVSEVKITDTMLIDQFPDQKNIIKLDINNIKKTFFLTNKTPSDSLKFE
ncbi:hypothetical protein MWU59_06740 [Flavobacteriaceae bacterium F08102]|nr:hypothetical protein [Flavobacteriaceae bacterium F08102]